MSPRGDSDVPKTEQAVPDNDIKQFRLNKPLSPETIRAIASETLNAGGCVEPPAEPRVGDKMPDGTVFAGISPDKQEPMYFTPADAPLKMKFNEAVDYTAKLDAHGHKDWRVPTKAELEVLFNNRAAIGGFGSAAGWHWSSTETILSSAWVQSFFDGYQQPDYKDFRWSVRPVRCGPQPEINPGSTP